MGQIGGIEWDNNYNHLGWSDKHGSGQVFVDAVIAAVSCIINNSNRHRRHYGGVIGLRGQGQRRRLVESSGNNNNDYLGWSDSYGSGQFSVDEVVAAVSCCIINNK